jgi:hypothetical protein
MKRAILFGALIALAACKNPTEPKPDRQPRAVVAVECVGLRCTIDATGSYSVVPIVNYRVSYGDYSVSWGQSRVIHDYLAPCSYLISVVVIDRDGGVSEWYTFQQVRK